MLLPGARALEAVKESEGLGARAALLSVALALCGIRLTWRSSGTRTRLPSPHWTDFDRAPTSCQTPALLSPVHNCTLCAPDHALGSPSNSSTELLLSLLLQARRGRSRGVSKRAQEVSGGWDENPGLPGSSNEQPSQLRPPFPSIYVSSMCLSSSVGGNWEDPASRSPPLTAGSWGWKIEFKTQPPTP